MTSAKDSHRSLTLRDVSEASGVSEMTVSRVLRNRGDVSAETRDRVLAAAKRLGYVQNRIAGALMREARGSRATAPRRRRGPPAR